ncbi:MAG: hypothetical protein CMH99_01375 [Oceanospirillaceae bacterium]|nr:hypothetical protein [Oceanospirillaceae bacterium]
MPFFIGWLFISCCCIASHTPFLICGVIYLKYFCHVTELSQTCSIVRSEFGNPAPAGVIDNFRC